MSIRTIIRNTFRLDRVYFQRLSPGPEPNSSATEEELSDEEQEQNFQQEIDYLESTGNLEPNLSTMAATGETHPEGSMFRRHFKNLAKHL